MSAFLLPREKVALWGILTVAFVLRIWGVHFGLPFLYHADEPIVVNHALAYGSGDLNPHFFNIPPLVSYLLFICYGGYFVLGRAAGLFHSVADFERLFYLDPTSFYFLGRLIFGVLLGVLAVYLLYRLAKRFWGPGMALWAAFLLAVNFLHARDSHYIYADIPLLCVLLWGFYAICLVAESPLSVKRHLLVGCALGLAAATKYNGIFLIIPYFWVCVRSVPVRKWVFLGGLSAMASIVFFLLFNPYAILDASFFIQELREQSQANSGGGPWFHHLIYSLAGAAGIPFLVISLLGLLRGLVERDIKREAAAIFVLGYYAVLCKWGQPYDRYVLPLMPFLCLFAGHVIFSSRQTLCDRHQEVRERSAVMIWWFALIGIVVAPSLQRIVYWDRLMSAPDVRTLAKSWIEAHIPPGSRIALDGSFFTPRLSFSAKQLTEKLALIEAQPGAHSNAKKRRIETLLKKPVASAYDMYFLAAEPETSPFLFAEPQIPLDIDSLKNRGIQFVVIMENFNRSNGLFLQELEKTAEPIMRFSPYRVPFDGKARDDQPLTGGPFLWEDIRARDRNGYPLTVYALR